MAVTQFCFCAVDGVVSAVDANNSTVESKTPSGTSGATTAASTAGRQCCRVATDTQVYVSFGASPNAGSDTIRFFLPAGAVEYFMVELGDKAAVITA